MQPEVITVPKLYAMKGTMLAVIDSYELIRYAFSEQLKAMGFNVVLQAHDGDDFMQQMSSTPIPEVCILDIDTPFIHQFTTAKRIKAQYPYMKIIAYTLYEKNYSKVEKYGIDRFITKDCSIDELKKNIVGLMHH